MIAGDRAVERLREKARDYELNALAAKERGQHLSHATFSAVAIVLYEVAESLAGETDDDGD